MKTTSSEFANTETVINGSIWACFVALTFDEMSSQELLFRARKVLRHKFKDIAWHQPSYLHLTVAYVGWCDHERANRCSKQIHDLSRKVVVPHLQLSGSLFTLGQGLEKYVVLGIKSSANLSQIRTLVRSSLQEVRVFQRPQRFTPHITLGRIRQPMAPITSRLLQVGIQAIKVECFASISSSIAISSQLEGG
jgi:2'-5' RNA ligase